MQNSSVRVGLLEWAQPWLAAIGPILFLAYLNLQQIELSAILLPAVAMSALVVILVGILYVMVRETRLSLALATPGMICFYAHGHVMASTFYLREDTGHAILTSVWIAILFVVARKLARNQLLLEKISSQLSLAVFMFFVVTFGQLLYKVVEKSLREPIAFTSNQVSFNTGKKTSDESPDIYYIILDGYARHDVLQEVYQHDNEAFLEGLQNRDFYIADESVSNYSCTFLSLSSSLNMTYHDRKTPTSSDSSRKVDSWRQGMYKMMRSNHVGRYLQEQGYCFCHINTTWGGTETSDIADIAIPETISEFNKVFIDSTMLGAIADDFGLRRDKLIRAQLDSIKHAVDIEKPKFVFAHMICPHPPFCFQRDGSIRGKGGAEMWSNKDGYVQQLEFIGNEVLELVDYIRTNSATPPVIIVQADHGSGLRAEKETDKHSLRELAEERMPILNAFHVPDSVRQELYPTITPVNTFRVLLNELFDAKFALAEDRSYYSGYDDPFGMEDVTEYVLGTPATVQVKNVASVPGKSAQHVTSPSSTKSVLTVPSRF